jgi:hypothetical protein
MFMIPLFPVLMSMPKTSCPIFFPQKRRGESREDFYSTKYFKLWALHIPYLGFSVQKLREKKESKVTLFPDSGSNGHHQDTILDRRSRWCQSTLPPLPTLHAQGLNLKESCLNNHCFPNSQANITRHTKTTLEPHQEKWTIPPTIKSSLWKKKGQVRQYY